MISRVGPRKRLFLRVVAACGLLGVVDWAVWVLTAQGSSVGSAFRTQAQALILSSLIFVGIPCGIFAVIIARAFGRQPDPLRFRAVMALGFFAVPFTVAGIASVAMYLSAGNSTMSIGFDLGRAAPWLAANLLFSQYAAGMYLRETAESKWKRKPARALQL